MINDPYYKNTKVVVAISELMVLNNITKGDYFKLELIKNSDINSWTLEDISFITFMTARYLKPIVRSYVSK